MIFIFKSESNFKKTFLFSNISRSQVENFLRNFLGRETQHSSLLIEDKVRF